MGPPDGTKIGLGIVAATTVALVSYFLVKKIGYPARSARRRNSDRGQGKEQEIPESEIFPHKSQVYHESTYGEVDVCQSADSSQDLRQYSAGENEQQNNFGDGHDQTSFIVIDNREGEVPRDDHHHHKKSDRSSDESSYDVIDDDRLEDAVEEGEGGKTEDKEKDVDNYSNGAMGDENVDANLFEEELIANLNDSSMVVIEDSDPSGLSKSGSSFYVSADENAGIESASSEQHDEEKEESKEERMHDLSRSDEEETIMFAGDVKFSPAQDDTIVREQHDPLVSSDDDTRKREMEPQDAQNVLHEPIHDKGTTEDQTLLEETSPGVLPVVSRHLPSSSPKNPDRLKIIAIADAVLGVDAPDKLQEISPGQDSQQKLPVLSQKEITEVLTTCQNSPMNSTKEDITKLVILFQQKNPDLRSTVLNCLIRVSAFTQNIDNLQESGCLEEVSVQIPKSCEDVAQGQHGAEATFTSLCQLLTNLSLDPKTHTQLEPSMPAIISLILLDSTNYSILISALRPLINMSSTNIFQNHYVHLIQKLFTLLDKGSHVAKVQSLKILVNLSLNRELVPRLLAAKAPVCLLDLLDKSTSIDLILRTVTMLTNVLATWREGSFSASSLPVEDKAPSPETLYTALLGIGHTANLRSRVFRLTRDDHEEVSSMASKLYGYLAESGE